jgi:hypothetical protein
MVFMRTTLLSLLALYALTGCYSTLSESRGVTRATYAGDTLLVFTNATPARMCNLSLASDSAASYGDNWLPEGGLPSGASLELRVQPGTYKATWSTCRDDFQQPFYAGTLYRELAFTLDRQEAQLYAFVSDATVPTKRAATLGRQFQLIRAVGQTIDPSRANVAAVPSYAERQLLGEVAPTAPTGVTAKIKLHDCIDWKLAKTTRKPAPAKTKKRPVATAPPSVHRKVRTF